LIALTLFPKDRMAFHLFVIEDTDDDYFLLFDALQRDGITCEREWCQSGEVALQKLMDGARTRLPDLIISDLDMPGLSGHAVLEQIRQQERLRKIPVVILTGSTSSDDRAYCPTADHYLLKPKIRSEWVTVTTLIKTYIDQQR